MLLYGREVRALYEQIQLERWEYSRSIVISIKEQNVVACRHHADVRRSIQSRCFVDQLLLLRFIGFGLCCFGLGFVSLAAVEQAHDQSPRLTANGAAARTYW